MLHTWTVQKLESPFQWYLYFVQVRKWPKYFWIMWCNCVMYKFTWQKLIFYWFVFYILCDRYLFFEGVKMWNVYFIQRAVLLCLHREHNSVPLAWEASVLATDYWNINTTYKYHDHVYKIIVNFNRWLQK